MIGGHYSFPPGSPLRVSLLTITYGKGRVTLRLNPDCFTVARLEIHVKDRVYKVITAWTRLEFS